jgi:hypothetical protein
LRQLVAASPKIDWTAIAFHHGGVAQTARKYLVPVPQSDPGSTNDCKIRYGHQIITPTKEGVDVQIPKPME